MKKLSYKMSQLQNSVEFRHKYYFWFRNLQHALGMYFERICAFLPWI
jgi:hypothetical protein